MVIVVDNVCIAAVTQCSHSRHRNIIGQRFGRKPSAKHFFITCISGRNETALIITAAAHQVPTAHSIVSFATRVIEIGQSQTMRELVTDGSDTVDSIKSELAATRISIHGNAIYSHGLSVIRCRQSPFVWPNRIGIIPRSLTVTGVENKNLIHFAVSVPIIVGKIH